MTTNYDGDATNYSEEHLNGNLVISEIVTSIGSYAFYGCSSLTSITIPASVTSIGERAFRYCSGLTTIKVDENNSVYDSRDNSNAIIETSTNTLLFGSANTVIPESVTSIGSYAFYGCSSLTSITIPESVTSIGNWAFYGCSSLTSVYFEHTTAPTFGFSCFEKYSGDMCTFYFKNSTVSGAFTTSYYNSSYGTKSTNYDW